MVDLTPNLDDICWQDFFVNNEMSLRCSQWSSLPPVEQTAIKQRFFRKYPHLRRPIDRYRPSERDMARVHARRTAVAYANQELAARMRSIARAKREVEEREEGLRIEIRLEDMTMEDSEVEIKLEPEDAKGECKSEAELKYEVFPSMAPVQYSPKRGARAQTNISSAGEHSRHPYGTPPPSYSTPSAYPVDTDFLHNRYNRDHDYPGSDYQGAYARWEPDVKVRNGTHDTRLYPLGYARPMYKYDYTPLPIPPFSMLTAEFYSRPTSWPYARQERTPVRTECEPTDTRGLDFKRQMDEDEAMEDAYDVRSTPRIFNSQKRRMREDQDGDMKQGYSAVKRPRVRM